MPTSLLVDTVLATTPVVVGGTALKMAANMWRIAGSPQHGVILVLAHGNGNHKEYWQPTIDRLLQEGTSDTSLAIREVWAFDWQDHGDSAVANDAVISKMKQGVSLEDWAKAIAEFVQERLMSHELVLVGHSAGCISLVYSMMCFPLGVAIPYKAFVLIEPPMHDRQYLEENYEERMGSIKFLKKAISVQPAQYDSPASGYALLSKRSPWKFWDERVRRLYVEKALRPLEPENLDGPQVVKCSKKHETAKFELEFEPMFKALDHFGSTCEQLPYHFVFGEIDDVLPRVVKDNAVDASRGRKASSVTRIPEAGHMIPQVQPDALGDVLRTILGIVSRKGTCTPHRL